MKMNLFWQLLNFSTIFIVILLMGCQKSVTKQKKTENVIPIAIETSMGEIVLELFPDKAPISVENFLDYVNSDFYNGTIFHRVINGFMIQGGGLDVNLNRKETKPPIQNEATNGLKNNRGTIAYARTNIINSATSQFFINQADNAFLNHKDNTPEGYGYAVFGNVVKGMDIVDKIASVKTEFKNGMNDVPNQPIIILSMRVVEN